MSKGSQVVKARVTDDVIAEMEAAIKKRNATTREEEWTLSDFIRKAVTEKLAKMKRCRVRRKKQNPPAEANCDTYLSPITKLADAP